MSILQVENLKKVYGKKKSFVAVDEISFDLKKGEILGLLGPNGSGKTTTIQMLLGTLSVSSGSIFYFGKDFFRNRSNVLQHISFASTYTSLPFTLSVEENLISFGYLYGLSNGLEKARPLLERFGLGSKTKSRVSSLSAGQVTRLMLVKAFFMDPKIVLLDEPTASLDPDIARDVCQFLLEQREKSELSILFTSHKMEEVASLCDRVIVLKNGKIIANDIPSALARSVSFYTVQLALMENREKAIELASHTCISFEIEHQILTCSIEEKKIPLFLNALMKEGVSYSNIQIVEPTLEDYFLKIAERSYEY